jgi:hypothetical protein
MNIFLYYKFMGRPTLYSKGSLLPLNPKVTKEELDNYLPIHYILNVMAYKLSKESPNIHDRLLFLKSETGSGKTTVLPIETYRSLWTKNLVRFGSAEDEKLSFRQMLPTDFGIFDFPDDPYTKRNRKEGFAIVNKKQYYIGCTQPKTITAVEKAKENSDAKDYNPDIDLGTNTGFTTGNFKQRFSEPAGLLYMTLGSLCQQLKSIDAGNRLMERYTHIFVDECHDRSTDLDITAVLLKNILDANAGNPSMPLIIFMSATFDLEKFAAFFETPKENAIYVVGESAKKTITFLDKPSFDYVRDTADLVMKIHKDGKDDPENERDILIFISGSPDNRDVESAVRALDKNGELIILKVDSGNYNSDRELIELVGKTTIKEAAQRLGKPNATRRVTISTNVAETGLTIPTLKYVIETGWEKATYYSPIHGLSMLVSKPVTQSSSVQRCGRVGRKFYGYAYCMYTEDDFKRFEEYKIPDIYTNDLTKIILELMYSKLPIIFGHRRLDVKEFGNFVKKCINSVNGNPYECNYIYNSIKDNQPAIDEHLTNGSLIISEIVGGSEGNHDYPPEMLDNITQDMYLAGRNKILSMGFYGNYVGYMASRIPRLSAEGIRMIFCANVYGASVNDMVNIAILMSAKTNDYLFGQMDESKSKGRVKQFSIIKLIEDLVSKENIRKHYLGSAWNFVELFYDDFIRSLMIIRWIVSKAKKLGPTKTMEKCNEYGIKFVGLMKVLDMRKSVMDSLKNLGIHNLVKELDFNDESIIDDICRVKKCIYSGYKNNVAYYRNGSYETNTGMKFSTEIFIKRKPEKIIYNHITMMGKRKSILYNVKADSVCSLAGII